MSMSHDDFDLPRGNSLVHRGTPVITCQSLNLGLHNILEAKQP